MVDSSPTDITIETSAPLYMDDVIFVVVVVFIWESINSFCGRFWLS